MEALNRKFVHQVYVHEWSPGDFVVWDNRSTLHSTTVTWITWITWRTGGLGLVMGLHDGLRVIDDGQQWISI